MKADTVLLLILLIAVSGNITQAQSGSWRVYTPTRGGFSIETPAPLLRVKSIDGEHGVNYDPEQNRHGIVSYAAVESDAEETRFGVTILGARMRAKFLRSQPKDQALWYLSVMLIHDDDDPTPDIEGPIDVNGLMGHEYFYIRDEQRSVNGSTGSIHTSGRIFDSGRRLYVIVFVGQNTEDLTSRDAERFLNSFQLGRRKR